MNSIVYGPLSEKPVADFWTLFESICNAQPHALAIRSGVNSYSYCTLREKAINLAETLINRNVRPGDRVGLLLWHSEKSIICTLACAYIGACFVPIDPSDPHVRIREIVDNSDIRAIVCSNNTKCRAHEIESNVKVISMDLEGETSRPKTRPTRMIVPLEYPSHILHTSGSTGEPKGVITSARSWIHFCQYVIKSMDVDCNDRVLFCSPYTFDVSVMDMGVALLSGAALIVPSVKQQKHSPSLSKLIGEHGVTIAFLTQRLALTVDVNQAASLRVLMVGGERILAKAVRRWLSVNRRVVNIYGPTETTVAPIMKLCEIGSKNDPQIGRPIDNHFVFLVEPNDRSSLIDVGVGEIVIGGIGIAIGYSLSNLHPERFSRYPYVRSGYCDRIYYTGDHGYWDENGELVFVGRADNQVKLNGVRIELNEVESALNAHPDVEIGIVKHCTSAHGADFLSAIVKLKKGQREIRGYIAHMEERLHKMKIPNDVQYVDDFNYTSSGKIQINSYA